MEVNKIDSSQSFKGLNIKKVAHEHRKYVRTDLGDLKKLGEKYDIKLKSTFDEESNENGIRITVKPLRENLKFFQKFNRPKGKSFFNTEYTKNNSVINQVENAIYNLRRKILLKAMF